MGASVDECCRCVLPIFLGGLFHRFGSAGRQSFGFSTGDILHELTVEASPGEKPVTSSEVLWQLKKNHEEVCLIKSGRHTITMKTKSLKSQSYIKKVDYCLPCDHFLFFLWQLKKNDCSINLKSVINNCNMEIQHFWKAVSCSIPIFTNIAKTTNIHLRNQKQLANLNWTK